MRSSVSAIFVTCITLLTVATAHADELLHDPTRPYVAPTAVATTAVGFKVSAIFMSDTRRVAILNGQRVYEGDEVDGATVIEILADRLIINYLGRPVTTRLASSSLR